MTAEILAEGKVSPAPAIKDSMPDSLTVMSPIDFRVYALLGHHWGKDDCGPPLWCDGMDLDGSEVVDLTQLSQLGT
jgi:hypothetical protein